MKEGHPKTIMSSYNKVNGTYANENAHLLQDILRSDWGFDGMVVTDWGGDNDHVAGVKAGSDLVMPAPVPTWPGIWFRRSGRGRVSESVLDARLAELLPVVRPPAPPWRKHPGNLTGRPIMPLPGSAPPGPSSCWRTTAFCPWKFAKMWP